ncbi:FtsK/SpoIIIE domain-containing protein [Streptomyces althioticus]|uniref:FtsK/SpoIIIE domain-containing protein n=1 Tax=Streptomyces althioticus TaxID=83380 RepID=UPI0033EFE8C3
MTTKTSRPVAAVINVLDELAPAFAPFAARWDREADRRKALRTPDNLKALMDAQRKHNAARSTAAQAKSQRETARKASSNPLSTARRSAAAADRAARQHRTEARQALQEARANYPTTLTTRAVQVHAAHVVPTAAVTYAMDTPWPVATSAALVALNVGGLLLGRRQITVTVDDGLTEEERQLVERLHPTYWVNAAPDRGLGGTVTTPASVTSAGLACDVRLDGQWTTAKLAAAEASIRALLGCRKGLRLRVAEGERGGWAVLTIGTRSAVDGTSLLWTPERQGIGLDTGTGEVVTLPHGRKVIAGTSGAGKSVLLRTVLAPYALDPLSTVIYLDAKGEESALWSHCAREAIDPADVAEVVAEVVAEMLARRDLMRREKVATWKATTARPRLVVLVDEGADLITMDCKATPILPGLEQVARQGRSRLVDLIWCTQKPTVGEGITSQIIGNMSVRVVLQTAGETETRQIMGKGWQNHHLPGPGLAYVRGTGRTEEQSAVAVWNASDDALVTALPARQPWSRTGRAQQTEQAPAPAVPVPPARPALHLVPSGGDFLLAPPAASPVATTAAAPAVQEPQTNRDRVLAAVVGGAASVKAVTEATGLNKGTVSREVKALVGTGHLTRSQDGALSPVAPKGVTA